MTESQPTDQSSNLKWWQRPVVWIVTVTLGAVGVFLADALVVEMKSVAPTGEVLPRVLGMDAVSIVGPTRIHDPFNGRSAYVVPGSADPSGVIDVGEGEPSRTDRITGWAEANKAVDVERSAWEVTLEGRRSNAVELVNIVPVLEEACRPPMAGGLFWDPAEGEGDKIILVVDVSALRPVVDRDDAEAGEYVENYFSKKKITLPKGEKSTLVLKGESAELHCRWRYRLEFVVDQKRTSFMLSAPGDRPFEVTGISSDYSVYDWVVPPYFCRDRHQIDGRAYAAYMEESCSG